MFSKNTEVYYPEVEIVKYSISKNTGVIFVLKYSQVLQYSWILEYLQQPYFALDSSSVATVGLSNLGHCGSWDVQRFKHFLRTRWGGMWLADSTMKLTIKYVI